MNISLLAYLVGLHPLDKQGFLVEIFIRLEPKGHHSNYVSCGWFFCCSNSYYCCTVGKICEFSDIKKSCPHWESNQNLFQNKREVSCSLLMSGSNPLSEMSVLKLFIFPTVLENCIWLKLLLCFCSTILKLLCKLSCPSDNSGHAYCIHNTHMVIFSPFLQRKKQVIKKVFKSNPKGSQFIFGPKQVQNMVTFKKEIVIFTGIVKNK